MFATTHPSTGSDGRINNGDGREASSGECSNIMGRDTVWLGCTKSGDMRDNDLTRLWMGRSSRCSREQVSSFGQGRSQKNPDNQGFGDDGIESVCIFVPLVAIGKCTKRRRRPAREPVRPERGLSTNYSAQSSFDSNGVFEPSLWQVIVHTRR